MKPDAAVWKDHLYTDKGKWMDGWESQRRREPGARLVCRAPRHAGHHQGRRRRHRVLPRQLPRVLRALRRRDRRLVARSRQADRDRRVDGARAAPPAARRHEERVPLVAVDKRFTHVRLEIFPDGGVARLRVHGEVKPRWGRLGGGPIDLAALEHGAVVETCSDMFFGSRNNLIKPGPSRSMADGWETRRRRGPGNDWAIVRLATSRARSRSSRSTRPTSRATRRGAAWSRA